MPMRFYKVIFFLVILFFLFRVASVQAQFTSAGKSVLSVPPDRLKKTMDSLKSWTIDGNVILNLSQVWLDNWVAGGDKSVAGNTINIFNINYKGKRIYWENTIKVATGMMQQQGSKLVKTDDKFEVITKFGRTVSKRWSYSGQCNFYTQFLPGYKNPTDTIKRSDFLAPAYIITSLGMNFNPVKQLSMQFSPIAGKITIVNSKHILQLDPSGAGAYGVKNDKLAHFEFGGSVVLSAKGTFFKKITYQSNFSSFSNFESDPLTNIDVNWELLLGLRITKFVSANLKTNFLYDIDASLDPQFKEFFGVGFSYKI